MLILYKNLLLELAVKIYLKLIMYTKYLKYVGDVFFMFFIVLHSLN